MPGLAKKLLVCAAVEGLLLHPVGPSSEGRSVKISYGSNTIASAARTKDMNDESVSFEAHGIVGLLDLVTRSFLITITKREQVAQVQGRAIFAISVVTLIPLESQSEAARAITAAQKHAGQRAGAVAEETDDSDFGEDAETESIGDDESKQPPEAAALEPPRAGVISKSSSFVKDVVQDKGKYGRFAERWFSKGGWKADGRKRQGMTSEENLALTEEQRKEAAAVLPDDGSQPHTSEGSDEAPGLINTVEGNDREAAKSEEDIRLPIKQKSVIESLTPRILRAARLYFTSSGFYFSYDYDLSGTLAQRGITPSSLPLWKRFDTAFFWNRHLLSPFIDAGQDAVALPLLQGFIGQRAFSIERTEGDIKDVVADAASSLRDILAAQGKSSVAKPSDKPKQGDFLLTLISRRSISRAGLRYLRRGVDDDGNVANYVETEQILSPQSWDTSAKTFSLVQVRGSIPLFFSQSPYSFKPLPIMFGSETTNQAAFKRHFEKVQKRYGAVQCASLVDKHGTEVSIGEAYEHHARLLNDHGGIGDTSLGFEWFDFHGVCKGMRFDKVTVLLDALESQLKSFGWNTTQDDRNIQQQTGVLRTNCMDCLDRTNVVQSAVGGWALQQQLHELGLQIDLQSDSKTQWFNTLWADNGDAISKQYAGTAALKGDFTRTRKRNWTGALSDFSLTLNRYYNNVFGDYFMQLTIDFFLGNVGSTAFDDFEADMMGQDYALDVRKIRQNAIDTCIKIVLEDPKEDLIAGWTLSCPHVANTLRSLPFEECVLLLTDAALYFCRFDWDAEKVGSFERVDLQDVTQLWRGAYITSTLGPTHIDETRNVGFALRYKTLGQAMVRTNTRAMSNEKVAEDEQQHADASEKEGQKDDHSDKPIDKAAASGPKQDSRLLAFKALPPKSSAAKKEGEEEAVTLREQELVKQICDEIRKAMVGAVRKAKGFDHLELEEVPGVGEKDVIGVAEARKKTGYLESLSYGLKRAIWS
ncbi:SAC1-recessive suppressor of secretory defect [Teratosphaeria destructans]|uniref:SAC1-recessive suppressor of secretory defect n=1 Tax=Teratosphaeria destructans TaxID=418781 RepID=A0A9W7W4C4_9PEZI|nr:SAC1-recessive suppressor of secretory defect [Teratosphaeria destructans]